MKNIKYTIHKEGKHYVSQCLNVDISSFGATIDEAVNNLIEALKLYFEDNNNPIYKPIENVMVGEKTLYA